MYNNLVQCKQIKSKKTEYKMKYEIDAMKTEIFVYNGR